jgi:GTP-binding protein
MNQTTPKTPIGLPKVALVGRPNVGKSTLLNRLCGSRVAIVEPTAGVTRDRVSVPARLDNPDGPRWIEVVDTGGVGIVDRDDLGADVERQVSAALDSADLVLFLLDARDGLTPLDQRVAELLRGVSVPVIVVANKCEHEDSGWEARGFHALGVGETILNISAQNGNGMSALIELLWERFPEAPAQRPVSLENSMLLAIVGRRNAGKSTLTNFLAGEERMIVSEIPGTTRDAVDVRFQRDGTNFVVIDTAGVRKKSKQADAIEFFGESRSRRTVRRAKVVILLFDVTQSLSAIEKALARYATLHYKPVVLAANKWDLVQDRAPEEFRKYLDAQLPGLSRAPIAFLSAKEGKGARELLDLALELHVQAEQRVSTGELNRVLAKALESRGPSARGQRARLKYATQAGVHPPTFVLFVNDRKLIGKDHLRYIENRIRMAFPFPEVPVRIVLRDKNDPPEEQSHRK